MLPVVSTTISVREGQMDASEQFTSSMTIAREEIFGPVLSIIPYEDETDAIRIANDTPMDCPGS